MYFAEKDLRRYGLEVMRKLSMTEADAALFIDNLVMSEMRGIHSHGFAKFHGYVERLERNVTSPTAHPSIVADSGTCIRVDGNNGMGSTTAYEVMEWCIERARQHGVCVAAVFNASHYGFGAYYALQAADQGMIGVNMCDCPNLVAPFGGAAPMLGTNPISVAIPAKRHPHFVMDMATSVVAKGKIALAMKEGHSIPEGWALDENGNPTTDPVAANTGVLLPMSGAKGYALGLIVDCLCSCLAGAADSRGIPRTFENPTAPSNIGYFMMAIDVSRFEDLDTFYARMDALFDDMKATPPAAGFREVMIPGEPEYRKMLESREKGIELSDAVFREMEEIGVRYGVALPNPLQ